MASYNDQTLLGTAATTARGELQSAASAVRADRGPREAAPGAAGAAARPAGRARAWQGAGTVRRLASRQRWPRARRGIQHVDVHGGGADRSGADLDRVQDRCAAPARPRPARPAASAWKCHRWATWCARERRNETADSCSHAAVLLLAHSVGECAGGAQPCVGRQYPIARRHSGRLAARERRRAAGIFHRCATARRWSTGRDWASSWRMRPSSSATSSSARIEQKAIDDTWEQPWGERRYVRNHCTELRVTLREKTGARRQLTVVFRVFDDGVGFRYEFPEQAALSQVNIVEELTEFDDRRSRPPPGGYRVASGIATSISTTRLRSTEVVAGAYAVDTQDRERRAHRHPRSGARGLFGHVAAARVGAAAEGRAVAVIERPRGEPQGAVRDALAHAADRADPRRDCTCRISSSISTSLTSSAMCRG